MAETTSKEPLVISQTSVPAGFEDLLAPQQSMIDVYFGGQFIATMSATFTPDIVEFLDPEFLVRQIPSLLSPNDVSKALYGELESHTEAICLNDRDTGCGIIEPQIAGFIFDESRFRADLFIHPDFLETRSLSHSRYLPDSTTGLGLVQNLSANISGNLNSDSSENNYTIFGNTLFSARENSLQMSWDISRDQNVSVNQLLLERDYQGQQWQAGLVYSSGFGLSFSGGSRLWGARLASSFNTRIDRSFTQGTPVEIFMPVKGRYEIIYEERLIASGFVDAGNQALDTSNFPGGAYDLTIRLLDEQGNLIREENRFFAKQSRLPSEGEPEYFVEGGRIAETGANRILPDLSDHSLIRAGINTRLADTWAGTFAMATSPGQVLGEGSVFHIGRQYELSGSLMLAGEKDYGIRTDGRYRVDALNLSASYIQLWRDEAITSATNGDDLLANAFRQTSFSANYPLFSGSASYRYSQSQNTSNDNVVTRQTRQTVSYGRPVYRDNFYSASMRLDTSWTNDGNVTSLLSIELRRSEDNWSFRASPQNSYSKTSDGTSESTNTLRVGATYNDRDTFAGQFSGSMDAEKSSGRTSAGVSTRYASTWGSANLNLNYADSGSSSNTSYSASLATSVTANKDVIAFGGESQSRSAVVVNIEGAALSEEFDVYVNNQRRGYALGGKASIIHLSPFNTYKIRIRPQQSGALYAFDEREYEVTLYPGNIAALDYEVKQVLVVYGRARLPDGTWLNHASVQGGEGLAVSDEFGIFQAEVSSETSELVFRKKGQECSIPLTPADYDNDFVNLGQIECSLDNPATVKN
ncbi:hypothetical protein ACH42_07770 [Endozoicomonas sp. (ex Bugula neritina AB1)]|nr:hypothetical protein ACH42_07770 [Endozoicomonas sp. (ex Bugula neritina AB1)]